MTLMLTNTLTRTKEEFVPLDPNGKKVTWYACGPTVYGPIHIGNARTIVMTDTMRRWMAHIGYEVEFISNITDIDDKIINKAVEEGLDSATLAKKYAKLYFDQIARLGVRKANQHPHATDYIQAQIDLIEKLIERGHAYVSSDGSAWFSVKSFSEYGKLSRRNLDDMQQGERVDAQQQQLKKDPLDFSLWKAAKPGEPSWKSPWGEGRPGWHLECSCMAMACTNSPTIDIHTGGSDLIFPHHENEIAQSEAASGKQFSRYWMHLAMMNIDGTKISKSLGNVVYLDGLLEKFSALTVRHLLISAHYRTELNYTGEALENAKKASSKYAEATKEGLSFLQQLNIDLDENAWKANDTCVDMNRRFMDSMNDDFNTAKAFVLIFEATSAIWVSITESDAKLVEQYTGLLLYFRSALGLTQELETQTGSSKANDQTDQFMELLIDVRQKARAKKAFDLSDEIRDRLQEMGIVLEDTPKGTRWKKE